jgi:hypothetical protein
MRQCALSENAQVGTYASSQLSGLDKNSYLRIAKPDSEFRRRQQVGPQLRWSAETPLDKPIEKDLSNSLSARFKRFYRENVPA